MMATHGAWAEVDRFIELTFVDRDQNEFVTLVTYRFPTEAAHEAGWASIPQGPADSAFLADRHDPDGCSDNREVSFEWIERVSGRPIAELIEDGRLRNRDLSQKIAEQFARAPSGDRV